MAQFSPSTILAATTGAGTGNFEVALLPMTLRITSGETLAGAEVVLIEYKDASENWNTLTDANASASTITAGKTCITIKARGAYRASKSATAGSIGLEVIECIA